MAKIIRDDVDRFFQYGLDIATRTIYMGSHDAYVDGESGVDYQMAESVIKALHVLDATNTDKPITIIMNNPGGEVYHGLAIFDAIEACQSDVIIKVFGHAMSMGSIILQAADVRIMAPNATFMMHHGTSGIYDHPKNVQKWAEEDKRQTKWMLDLYVNKIREKHPKFLRKKVDEMCNFDTILSAEKTVELGLADYLLGEEDDE